MSASFRSFVRSRYRRVLDVKRRAHEHDIDIVAAGLSFYGLLGLFPALLALVSVYGLIADPASVEGMVDSLASTLPPQARALVVGELGKFVQRSSGELTFSLVFGIVAVLWSSSSGMSVLVRAINVAYEIEERRSFFARRLLALLLTMGAVAAVAFVVPAFTALPRLLHLLDADSLNVTIPPLGLGSAAFAALLLLFRYAPYERPQRFADVLPGAGLAAVTWLVVSAVYSLYVRYLARLTSTYGALEGVIVLELWFYFSSLVLLYAAELNVVLAEHRINAGAEKRPAPGEASPRTQT